MQWITLAAGPGTARPDHVLARCIFSNFRDCFVVPQWIEIVLVPSTHTRRVLTSHRRSLAEVNFNRANTKLQQISYPALIPLDRFWITKVDSGVLRRKLAAIVLDVIPLVDHLLPQIVLTGEVLYCQRVMRKPNCFKSAIIFAGSGKREGENR